MIRMRRADVNQPHAAAETAASLSEQVSTDARQLVDDGHLPPTPHPPRTATPVASRHKIHPPLHSPHPHDRQLAIGSYVYRIEPANPGLIVRRECTRGPLTLLQAFLIADATEFEGWCASQPTRFEDPRLHTLLRRAGHELLHRPE